MICNSSNNILLIYFTDNTSTKTHISQSILPTTNKNKATKKSQLQPSTICLRSKATDTKPTRHSARLANAAKCATITQIDKKHTGNISLPS